MWVKCQAFRFTSMSIAPLPPQASTVTLRSSLPGLATAVGITAGFSSTPRSPSATNWSSRPIHRRTRIRSSYDRTTGLRPVASIVSTLATCSDDGLTSSITVRLLLRCSTSVHDIACPQTFQRLAHQSSSIYRAERTANIMPNWAYVLAPTRLVLFTTDFTLADYLSVVDVFSSQSFVRF